MLMCFGRWVRQRLPRAARAEVVIQRAVRHPGCQPKMYEVHEMTTTMAKQVLLVKSLVTVQTVRSANGKLMGMANGTSQPVAPNTRVAQKLGSVSESGRRAMEAMRK